MREILVDIRYEEAGTGETKHLQIWDSTGDDIWELIDAYDKANNTDIYNQIERVLDVDEIDVRYVVKVKRQKDRESRVFRIGTGWGEVEDILEYPKFNMWDVFLRDMSDSINELYRDWKEMVEEIIWDDLEKDGVSRTLDGFEIREVEESE